MKKPIEKAAEYIYNSAEDICSTCCADFKRCNSRYTEDYTPPKPRKSHCIKSIIKFFEDEANKAN